MAWTLVQRFSTEQLKLVFDSKELRPLPAQSAPLRDVEDARSKVFLRVTRYLLFESILGLSLTAACLFFGLAMGLKNAVASKIQKLFDAHTFQNVDRGLSTISHEHFTSV